MQTLTIPIILLTTYLLSIFATVLILKDLSIGNFTWGGGAMLAGAYSFIFMSNFEWRQIIITIFLGIWGIRLTSFLLMRYCKAQDPRFAKWRSNLNAVFIFKSFAWVVLAQGILLVMMASPFVLINIYSTPTLTYLDYVGIIGWLFGFIFECVADYQLHVFKNNPENKNKILQTGLWKYSRHPNYFGESVLWWSWYLMALQVPYGWATIVAPLAMTCILRFFSAPLIEKTLGNNPEYKAYQENTSMFVPWFK